MQRVGRGENLRRKAGRFVLVFVVVTSVGCPADRTRPEIVDDVFPPRIPGGSDAYASIIFPPNPPLLGLDLSGAKSTPRGLPRWAPIEELPDHVMEPFFAPLSSRTSREKLTREQAEILVDYVDRRSKLRTALRAKLASVRPLPATARLAALVDFALVQANDLAGLEVDADAMRRDFYDFAFMGHPGGDWNELRRWRLGLGRLDRPREENALLELQVVRAAAFYQEGLAPEQRRLLREAAMEMEPQVFPRDDAADASTTSLEFFSPDLAQIHFPEPLSAELKALLEEFRAGRAALRQEVRDAIYELDRVRAGTREEALQDLAVRQVPQVESLEALAERIRRLAAQAGLFAQPSSPAQLPGDLEQRLLAYKQKKDALVAEFEAKSAAYSTALRESYRERGIIMPVGEFGRLLEAERERIRREQAGDYEDLARDAVDLRSKLEPMVGSQVLAGGPEAFDAFLATFLLGRHREPAYADYQTAALEPGLSPEQRRLLFGAAITDLKLPLLDAEKQPRALPAVLLK